MKTKFLISLLLIFCIGIPITHAQVVLSEGFNVTSSTNSPPSGWTINSSGTTYGCYSTDWEQIPSGGFNCTNNGTPQPRPNAQSGTGMAGYNSWDIAAGSWSDLISPALNFSGLGTYTVSFYVHEQQAFYGDDSLRVMINTSPTSTGATLLGEYVPNYFPPNSYGWAQYTLNIPTTFNGTSNYIIFRGVSDYGYDVIIDEVVVTRIPPTPCTGTPQTPSITTATMTTPLCTGSSYTINAVDPNLPTTSGITYQWESSASASGPWTAVSTGSGATTLSYTTPNLSTSTYYRMALTCAASTTTIYTGTYLVQVGAPQPAAIQGPASYCPNDPIQYTVTNVSGTTYTWTLPSGWSGTSTTNTIQATPTTGGSAVTISVTATSSCGTSIPRTLVVSPGSAPSPPNGINGNSLFCANTTQTYTVAPVAGAQTYIWTLPSGWSGTSTTNSITATNTLTSGNITVQAVNGCGQSPATVLHVNSIVALDPIGAITGKDTVCSGSLNTYYIHPVPGATSYVWTLPSGWSGTTADTLIQVFAGPTGGSITVTAYVSCATSAPETKVIRVIPTVVPTVSLSAQAGTLCSGQPITITATSTGGGPSPAYQWFLNGNAITTSGAVYITNSLVPGDVLQVTMTSSALCATPVQVSSSTFAPPVIPATVPGVNINSLPGDAVCSGTTMTFNLNSTGTGNAPSYQWQKNGVDIFGANGTSFTSASLADGDTITVRLISSATCAPPQGVTSNKIGLIIRDTLVPGLSISVSPGNVINLGDEVTFSVSPVNGGATPTYQWIRNGVAIPFETNATYTTSSLKPGDQITARMVSYLNCAYPPVAYSNPIMLAGYDLSVGTQASNGSFELYPNPTTGKLNLKADLSNLQGMGGVRIEIMNAIGQVVHRVDFNNAAGSDWKSTIELPGNLPNGQYLLQLRNTETDDVPVHFVRQFHLLR